MTDEERNARFIEHGLRLVRLEDVGTPMGALFRCTRESAQIPAERFARAMDIPLQVLLDIEAGRRPFPTMFVIFIFTFGIPEWYRVKECDAYDEAE